MRSLSSVGLGLSVVFGCLVLALMAEIYYLLWWKRRWHHGREIQDDYINPATEVLYKLCWVRQSCSLSVRSSTDPQKQLLKQSDDDANGAVEMEMEMEMVMAAGPPRLLFTIKEETHEDLESEDGKLSNSKGGDDDDDDEGGGGGGTLLIQKNAAESPPYSTPLSSPQFFFTPPLTPVRLGSSSSSSSSHNYYYYCSPGGGRGYYYNPFFESSTDAEFNRRIRASPPPAFKFLRDAEEKFEKRKREEEEAEKLQGQQLSVPCNRKMLYKDEAAAAAAAGAGGGSFVKILVV
ncbi:hypothetical protein Dimus_021084 [Dionaea muscipula]